MTKQIFQYEINLINEEIELLSKLNSINLYLQQYNWIFLHPYSQGIDIGILQRLSTKSENPKEEILNFFAKKFLDLRNTIHFIDGIYSKRPFLKEYSPSIEESVILCIQKDFNGAINVLLPVIEGTLRKYLVSKQGIEKEQEINISKLLNAFELMTIDYVDLQKKYLKKQYRHLVATNKYFDTNQEKQILKKHKEYFELWIKQLKNYLQNNLYLNTKHNSNITDSFNRHLIFHALNQDIEYSFSNYLRLFNCINFLGWAIGVGDETCSILPELDEEDMKSKWVDYFNILIISEALTETKNNIYKNPVVSFKKYLDPKYLEILRKPEKLVKNAIELNQFLKVKYN